MAVIHELMQVLANFETKKQKGVVNEKKHIHNMVFSNSM